MTKLNRVTAKIFGETASPAGDDPQIGQFGSAKIGTYIGTSDISTIQELPAWSNGWIDAVTPNQQFPTLPEMTGVHKVLSQQIAYLLQQGVPEWDSATTYYANNFCSKDGKLYVSKTDENLNNDPENDSTNWEEFTMGGSGNEVGDIIWRLLPSNDAGKHLLDGALIDGSGSYSRFVNYIADLYANGSKISNVTKIGSLTDNNGVLSGFSTSNYARISSTFSPSSNTWEVVIKANLTSLPASGTSCSMLSGLTNPYIVLEVNDDGKLQFSIGNGSSWILSAIIGTTVLQTNTDYWFKLVFNGTTYTAYSSTDGSNWTQESTATNNVSISGATLNVGISRLLNNYFQGSIDLKESYININGQRWWTGTQPAWAIDEATWQATVAQYGACGKFVYDSTNNTVRLPKVTGIVEGTIDATALGELVEAGLPSHNHNLANNILSNSSLAQGGYLSFRSDFGGGDYKYNLCSNSTSPTLEYQVRQIIQFMANQIPFNHKQLKVITT